MIRWNSLLVTGGVLDQPSELLLRVEVALDEEEVFMAADATIKALQNNSKAG